MLIEPLLNLGQLRNIGYIPNVRNDYDKRVGKRFLNFRLDSWLIIKIDNFNKRFRNIGDVWSMWTWSLVEADC